MKWKGEDRWNDVDWNEGKERKGERYNWIRKLIWYEVESHMKEWFELVNENIKQNTIKSNKLNCENHTEKYMMC